MNKFQVWAILQIQAANFTTILLEKLIALPVRQWRYTNESAGMKHLGPVAQDFKAAFGLGDDDKTIGTLDADGVALAAIQGLNQKLEAQIASHKTELQAKDSRIANLEQRLATLEKLLTRATPQFLVCPPERAERP